MKKFMKLLKNQIIRKLFFFEIIIIYFLKIRFNLIFFRFIKLFDVGQQLIANHVRGYVPCKIVFFLMNMHIIPRDIFLTRAAESHYE